MRRGLVLAIALVGCARYEAKPLDPDKTAADYEARTLDSPGLRRYLRREPPKVWDLSTLTLVAFYYHPDLDVARARWATAEAAVVTAGARPNPTLSITPEYVLNAADPWIVASALDLPLETMGKRGYRMGQAQHLSEAARLNIAGVAWEVRNRLRSALVDLNAAEQSELRIAQQLSIQSEIALVLEQRLTTGDASQPEVTQAHLALNQSRLALDEVRRQSGESRVKLAQALAIPSTALGAVSYDGLEVRPSLTAEMRRQALLHRPDLLAALAEYAASESALQKEIANQYPDVHLGPGYSFDQGSNKWALGLSISLPVFNRNEGPIAEAEAKRQEAAARFQALQARVIADADRARESYQAALKKLETANAIRADQERQLASAQKRFDAGDADRLTLLSAKLEREAAELAWLEARVGVQRAIGDVESAVQWQLPEVNPK